jgi:uncharacterized lipoprotein YmbA
MNMNNLALVSLLLTAVPAGLALTGCSFLKPSGVTSRAFVLTAVPASPPAHPSPPALTPTRVVGLGFVRIPDHLFERPLAVRHGTHEILYLQTAHWAERLDHGLQRSLAHYLTTQLPDTQVLRSTWRPKAVTCEIHLTVDQFDVDTFGEARLDASWRLGSPGDAGLRVARRFQSSRSGPAPEANPEGAVATLSALVAELGRALAQDLEAMPH